MALKYKEGDRVGVKDRNGRIVSLYVTRVKPGFDMDYELSDYRFYNEDQLSLLPEKEPKEVVGNKTAAFLYLLMRDVLEPDTIESVLWSIETADEFTFEEKELGECAISFSNRLNTRNSMFNKKPTKIT